MLDMLIHNVERVKVTMELVDQNNPRPLQPAIMRPKTIKKLILSTSGLSTYHFF